MMKVSPWSVELSEEIILERWPPVWVALSLDRLWCSHPRNGWRRHRRISRRLEARGWRCAPCLLQAISLASSLAVSATPQILVETAGAVIDHPEHVACLLQLGSACRRASRSVR